MGRAELRVEVAYGAGPGETELVPLALEPGATLADALLASGLLARHGLSLDSVRAGIWGKVRDPATVLRERDRVEIYRALKVDPKEARRQRYKRHLENAAKR
jgi:uncharacterized protein